MDPPRRTVWQRPADPPSDNTPLSSTGKRRCPNDTSSTAKRAKRGKHLMADIDSIGTSTIGNQATAEDSTKPAHTFVGTHSSKDLISQMVQIVKSLPGSEKDITGEELKQACRAFTVRGAISVDVTDPKRPWILKGALTPLHTHQLLGAGEMRRREKDTDGCRGGLLADEPGLGKTFMMLANILNGCLDSPDGKQTTLVVANGSLLKQWIKEIKMRCDPKALRRHATYTPKFTEGFDMHTLELMIGDNTIVFATYKTIMNSYGCGAMPDFEDDEQGWHAQAQWEAEAEEKKGILHHFEFHRIVLDECTAIKNHNSQTSIACRALKAKHYWLLSGTPIVNGVEEIFPYLSFLRYPGITDMRGFKARFFHVRKGETAPSEDLKEVFQSVMIRRTHNTKTLGQPILALPKLTCYDITPECGRYEAQLHIALQERVKKQISDILARLEQKALTEKQACEKILQFITYLRLCSSHFWLIAQHVAGLLEKPQDIRYLVEETAGLGLALSSGSISAMADAFQEAANSYARIQDYRKEWRALGQPMNQAPKYSRFDIQDWLETLGHCMLYSAKDLAVYAKLREWLTENPNRKIIVFAQFIAQLEIIKSICDANGWGNKMFHGGKSVDSRERAKEAWEKTDDIPILLASLQTGGIGLNLVAASRAIIVDLWWNKAMEDQATARLHRMGQEHETEVVRIVVKGSYDQRLDYLQKKKAASIADIMANGKRKTNATLQDLCELAGVDMPDAGLKDTTSDEGGVTEDDIDDKLDAEQADMDFSFDGYQPARAAHGTNHLPNDASHEDAQGGSGDIESLLRHYQSQQTNASGNTVDLTEDEDEDSLFMFDTHATKPAGRTHTMPIDLTAGEDGLARFAAVLQNLNQTAKNNVADSRTIIKPDLDHVHKDELHLSNEDEDTDAPPSKDLPCRVKVDDEDADIEMTGSTAEH